LSLNFAHEINWIGEGSKINFFSSRKLESATNKYFVALECRAVAMLVVVDIQICFVHTKF
jgi:hypothetical protein